jgi:hypothetical protein
VIVDIGENGRADVVSGLESVRPSFAAGDESRPLCDTLLDQRLDSIPLPLSAARLATSIPAAVDPVKETMSMYGCCEIAVLAVGPVPSTRL